MKVTTSAFARVALNRQESFKGNVHEVYRSSSGSNGFIKPDKPKINNKVDGYRRPSSYNCPAISRTSFVVNGDMGPHTTWDAKRVWAMSFEGGAVGTVEISSLPVTNHNVNNVRMKVLNNVRDEVLDVAMVLAEISGTANTVTNGLLRLARSMDQIRLKKPDSFWYLLNGRRRDGRRPTDKFLRESAGVYLEWKYGIMPTVYDIRGAAKALDMTQDGSLFDNPPLLVARAVDRSVKPAVSGIVKVPLPGGGITSSRVSAFTVTDELKARLDYRVSGEGLRGLNRFGLGLGSVATVAFDKTPFSFVLNMAVPIAELIKAWTALAGVDVVGYCETRYRRVDVLPATAMLSHGWHDKTPIPYGIKPQEGAYVDFTRTAYGSPPMPAPYIRNPVKTGNLATVLSLFTQLRKPSP